MAKGKPRKGPGGCKPKLPPHLKRKVDTIWILPHEWAQLDEIGPSRGKAVSKLLAERSFEFNGLCDLKSQIAKNAVGDLLCTLEARVERHENGDWELISEALSDYQNDIKILKNLRNRR